MTRGALWTSGGILAAAGAIFAIGYSSDSSAIGAALGAAVAIASGWLFWPFAVLAVLVASSAPRIAAAVILGGLAYSLLDRAVFADPLFPPVFPWIEMAAYATAAIAVVTAAARLIFGLLSLPLSSPPSDSPPL